MGEPIDVFLGFDPGGRGNGGENGNFGWSICTATDGQFRRVCSGRGDFAVNVYNRVVEEFRHNPSLQNVQVKGAGIDGLLFWEADGNLRRNADEIIRPLVNARVFTINEANGTLLAQSVLLARFLRHHFRSLLITETHPGALAELVPQMPNHIIDLIDDADEGGHQRDATYSAYAAWQMYERVDGWHDLFCREPNPFLLLDFPIHYWMPIPAPQRHP